MIDRTWDERRLRIATEAAGVALWSWNVDTDQCAMDARAFDLWGLPVRDRITFEELSAQIHPEDLDKVRAAFNSTRDLTGAYELDFRILHGDDVRWVSARGRGDDEGIRDRIMFGVFLDVTARKLAEEAREMVTGEMQHRIKNLFSLTSALAGISSRTTETKEDMTRDFLSRLHALSAAHDLIHPEFGRQRRAVFLQDLLVVLLKAYSEDDLSAQGISISTPEILVGEHSTTTLALIIHELATNAAKYGALSDAAGRLDISCSERDGDLELVWAETGCAPPLAQLGQPGFGSKMTGRVFGQIGGSIAYDWTDDGVVVTLQVSKARLGA